MLFAKEKQLQSRVEAQRKYNATHDVTSLKCQAGTFDRIRKLGYPSINGFAVQAVLEKLEREENKNK